MKKLSISLLSSIVVERRKAQNITQAKLSELSGINRAIISRIESQSFIPSIEQLESLADSLGFDPTDVFIDEVVDIKKPIVAKRYNIAVAGTGYVGLSLAVLLSQHNDVTAVDIIEDKVIKLNNYVSPIQDEYIEKFLKEETLDLTATLDGEKAIAQHVLEDTILQGDC